MKHLLLPLLILTLISLIGIVGADSCNPSDLIVNCNVSSSITLNGSDYNFNGSLLGALQINASNIILDCNGSTFYGNSSGYAIYNSIYDNVTVKNCNFKNYSTTIYFFNGCNNGFLTNNTINNSQYAGISLRYSSYNVLNQNNIFNSGDGFDLSNSNSNNLTNNYILNISSYGFWIRLTSANNIISNNKISNVTLYGIYFDATSNNNASNNQVNYTKLYSYLFGTGSSNNTARDDSFYYIETDLNNGYSYAFVNTLGSNLVINATGNNVKGMIYLSNSSNDTIENSNYYSVIDTSLYPVAIKVNSISYNFSFINNRYYNNYTSHDGYCISNTVGWSNSIIRDSLFTNCGEYRDYNSNYETIYNSSFLGVQTFFNYQNVTNLNITLVTLTDSDKFGVINATNFYFYNNTIFNMSTGADGYYQGLSIEKSNNFYIYNNNVTNAQTCYQVRDSKNGIFDNDYCDTFNLTEYSNLRLMMFEPMTSYNFVQNYKHYPNIPVNETDRDYDRYSHMNVTNVTITNARFGNNVQVLLRSQGNNNITFDSSINNFWFRSFRVVQLLDRDDFYISNNYDCLSNINYSNGNINYLLGIGSYWWTFNDLYYKFCKNYSYYYRPTTRADVLVYDNGYGGNNSVFNLSSSLITFSNLTALYQSGNNLELNLTLNPNEYVYIFQDFNKFDRVKNYTWLVSILGKDQVDNIYNYMGWTNIRSIEECNNSSTILTGFLIMIPIIIVLVVFLLILGFKNGMFSSLDSPDKLLPILGSIIFLLLVIGIGSIIIFSIGGC